MGRSGFPVHQNIELSYSRPEALVPNLVLGTLFSAYHLKLALNRRSALHFAHG